MGAKMILKGFIGTVYVRIDRDNRIDLWRSDTWLEPNKVLEEMLEKKVEILEQLAANSEEYGGYNFEEGEDDPDNIGYIDSFEEMIDDIRPRLSDASFGDSFEDVEISICPQSVRIPQMTEYEWAKICEDKAL